MAPAIKAVRGEQPHRHVSFACFVSVSPRTAGSWDRDTARHDTAVTRGRRLPDPAGTARGSLAYGNEGAGRPRPRGPPDRHRRLRRRARGELAPSYTCLLLCFHAGRDGRKGRTRVHGTIRPVMCLDGLHPLHISEPGGGAFSRNPQRACTCRCSALCASLVYLPCRTRKQRADDGGEG